MKKQPFHVRDAINEEGSLSTCLDGAVRLAGTGSWATLLPSPSPLYAAPSLFAAYRANGRALSGPACATSRLALAGPSAGRDDMARLCAMGFTTAANKNLGPFA